MENYNNEQKYTCAHCGAILEAHESNIAPNGARYCDECTHEVLAWCDRCESWHFAEEVAPVHCANRRITEDWCETCRAGSAFICADCGEWWHESYETVTRYNSSVCPHCVQDYCYCDECNEYVTRADFDEENNVCRRCAPLRIIKSYHHANKTKCVFGKVPRGQLWHGIGLEIEVDRRNRDTDKEQELVKELHELLGERAVFERDGSLNNGFEIITRPHTVADFYENFPLRAMLEACRRHGYLAHDIGTCGLHMHISRAFFGRRAAEQERAIGKLLTLVENRRDDFLKASRRDGFTFDRWAAAQDVYSRRDAREKSRHYNAFTRYAALNTSNRNTVEWRLMRGTLNEATFRACVDFLLTISKNARRIRWDAVGDMAQWLDGITPATREYLARRGAFADVIAPAANNAEEGDE